MLSTIILLTLAYTIASTYAVIINVKSESGVNEIINKITIKDLLTGDDNEYNETDNPFVATKIPLDDKDVMSLFHDTSALGITPDLRWAAIWYLWAILWGTAFVEDICGKKLGKFVPYLQVFEGIVTAWVPGVMMLLQIW